MSEAFQEAQFQASKIEESTIFMDRLHPMAFVSEGKKYVQFNPYDSL